MCDSDPECQSGSESHGIFHNLIRDSDPECQSWSESHIRFYKSDVWFGFRMWPMKINREKVSKTTIKNNNWYDICKNILRDFSNV